MTAPAVAIETVCWICHQPARWKMTAEKEGEPSLVIVWWSCEHCVPFAYEVKKAS